MAGTIASSADTHPGPAAMTRRRVLIQRFYGVADITARSRILQAWTVQRSDGRSTAGHDQPPCPRSF